jgi:hypothetical protein
MEQEAPSELLKLDRLHCVSTMNKRYVVFWKIVVLTWCRNTAWPASTTWATALRLLRCGSPALPCVIKRLLDAFTRGTGLRAFIAAVLLLAEVFATGTVAKHLHGLSDDVSRVALNTALVGVLARLETTFDVD